MTKQILINLPVADAEASKAFFTSLGLSLNEALSDERATCFNIEDNIIIALLPAEHFQDAVNGNKTATAGTHETLLGIGVDSKKAVDDLLDRASAAGGQELYDRIDIPEIYGGTFKDLDGHLWNVFYMR